MKQGTLFEYAMKVHLLDWKCHYFPRGGRVLERTTLSLCRFVTIGLGGVGVKAMLDNVTKYEVVFFEGFPNTKLIKLGQIFEFLLHITQAISLCNNEGPNNRIFRFMNK